MRSARSALRGLYWPGRGRRRVRSGDCGNATVEAMTDEIKAVEFVAEIRQVKTMADHTANWVLNVPEYCQEQSAEMLKHHGFQVRGVLEFIQVLTDEQKQNGEQIDGRTARNPLGVDSG